MLIQNINSKEWHQQGKSFLPPSPRRTRILTTPLGKSTFVGGPMSSREVPACHGIRRSENKCVEEGKNRVIYPCLPPSTWHISVLRDPLDPQFLLRGKVRAQWVPGFPTMEEGPPPFPPKPGYWGDPHRLRGAGEQPPRLYIFVCHQLHDEETL